jgi:hypothetical protein
MITNLFANMLFLYYFDAQCLLLYIIVILFFLFNRMNHKLNHVAARASRDIKSLFQWSSSSGSRREAMLRCACREGEEQQRGEEEQGGEEEEHREEEEEAELERLPRQTRRSHMVAPPIASA